MPKLLLACLVTITAFAAGVTCAWLVTRPLEQRLDRQFEFAMTKEPESRARLSLYTIQSVQVGNYGAALKANCQMLRSSLPLLRIAESDTPAQRKAMHDLVSRGEAVVSTLEKANACGP